MRKITKQGISLLGVGMLLYPAVVSASGVQGLNTNSPSTVPSEEISEQTSNINNDKTKQIKNISDSLNNSEASTNTTVEQAKTTVEKDSAASVSQVLAVPSGDYIDGSWLPITDASFSSLVQAVDVNNKPIVSSKYNFYPTQQSDATYTRNGVSISPITNDNTGVDMNTLGDVVNTNIIGKQNGTINVSGSITKTNSNQAYLSSVDGVFPGVTKIGASDKKSINDFTTYGQLHYGFDKALSGQLTLTDLDENEAFGIPLDQITKVFVSTDTVIYGKIVDGWIYLAGSTYHTGNDEIANATVLFDQKNGFDFRATTEASVTQIGFSSGSLALVKVTQPVTVSYVDEEGNDISPSKSVEGEYGEAYNETWIPVEGYSYKALGTDSDKPEGSFDDNSHHIIFVYSKVLAGADVTAKYVDTEGHPLSDNVVKSGNVGEDYTTEQKTIEGYTFKEVQGNTVGKFRDEAQTVTYIYTKNPVAGADVTAKYVDTEGHPISDNVVKSGNVGEDYTTEQKTIEGYTFKEVQGNTVGKFRDEAQTVTYIYTKNVVPVPNPTPRSSSISKYEPSKDTTSILPQTGDNSKAAFIALIVGGLLLITGLILSVLRIKRSK